jgi:hypothetical protein
MLESLSDPTTLVVDFDRLVIFAMPLSPFIDEAGPVLGAWSVPRAQLLMRHHFHSCFSEFRMTEHQAVFLPPGLKWLRAIELLDQPAGSSSIDMNHRGFGALDNLAHHPLVG